VEVFLCLRSKAKPAPAVVGVRNYELCPEVAIASVNGLMRILEEKCTGCKICLKVCPVRAITEE
jgi:MinD superfamily P-loop ATPase